MTPNELEALRTRGHSILTPGNKVGSLKSMD